MVRGDFIHDRGTKQRIVFESEDPITALEVREGGVTVLYIATTGRLSTLIISGKGQGQPARTIDNLGCGVGCMTIDKSSRDIIVARDDAVYSYGAKGRGASFAFEGPKNLIKMYQSYVGIVCPPRVAQISKSKTFRRLGADEVDGLFTTTSFSLLDTDLRFVAHTEQLSSAVKDIFVEWGELYLVTMDGKVCSEKGWPSLTCANSFSYTATKRSHCSKNLRFCTNGTSISLPSISRKRKESTKYNRTSSSGSTGIISIRKETTILRCSSTSEQSTIPSHLRSLESSLTLSAYITSLTIWRNYMNMIKLRLIILRYY